MQYYLTYKLWFPLSIINITLTITNASITDYVAEHISVMHESQYDKYNPQIPS